MRVLYYVSRGEERGGGIRTEVRTRLDSDVEKKLSKNLFLIFEFPPIVINFEVSKIIT